MKREILVYGIILLFLGLALSPSIYADRDKLSLEEDLIEIDVEFYGLGRKQTVKITQEQYDEIKLIFDDVQDKLSLVESDDEAVEIFNEAIVKLDKYGLLGGWSVKQVQRLITSNYKSIVTKQIRNNKFFKNLYEPEVINYLCLFTAYTIDAFEINIWHLLAYLFGNFYYRYHLNIFFILNFLLIEFGHNKPLRLLNQIDIGVGVAWSYFTIGILGMINGSYDFHTADGFSGIKIISKQEPREAYYIGFALRVTKKFYLKNQNSCL